MAVGLISAVVLIVAGSAVGISVGTARHDEVAGVSRPSPTVASAAVFTLAGVPADVARHYHAAREAPGDYRAVPCFCGCEATLDHRNLFDCFVTPAGTWEPHAAGCAVCIQESEIVVRMQARGVTRGEMRERLVDAFAGPATIE
jgi:hypothetical protein